MLGCRKEGDQVWHTLGGDGPLPQPGDTVYGEIDWDRRHALMRTHTALHVLCGVIWNEWGKAVTGGNMEPLSARMDFEFDPLPEGFGARVEQLVNAELRGGPAHRGQLHPPGPAVLDPDLIRTKVSLVPESVNEIRVVDIVGLDKQADGGTHVRSTDEVGRIRVVKTESKGKGNKRIRLEVVDAASSARAALPKPARGSKTERPEENGVLATRHLCPRTRRFPGGTCPRVELPTEPLDVGPVLG